MGVSTFLPTAEVAGYRRAQFRTRTDEHAVQDIALHLQHGGTTDPIVVFEHADGTRTVADGHHRLAGHVRIGQPQIAVEIHRGTFIAALEFGIEANRKNQFVRVTTADKQNAIAMLLREGCTRSDRELAERVGVDHKTIGKHRAALQATGEIPQSSVRIGADGRAIDTAKIGMRPAAAPAAPAPAAKHAPRSPDAFVLDEADDEPEDAPTEPVLDPPASALQRALVARGDVRAENLSADLAVSELIVSLREFVAATRARLERLPPHARGEVLSRSEDAALTALVGLKDLLLPSTAAASKARAAFGVIQGGKS